MKEKINSNECSGTNGSHDSPFLAKGDWCKSDDTTGLLDVFGGMCRAPAPAQFATSLNSDSNPETPSWESPRGYGLVYDD